MLALMSAKNLADVWINLEGLLPINHISFHSDCLWIQMKGKREITAEQPAKKKANVLSVVCV